MNLKNIPIIVKKMMKALTAIIFYHVLHGCFVEE